MAVLTRTLGPENLPLYAETWFSCVLCAYYQQKLCGHKNRMPQLWGGEERSHFGHKKHLCAASHVAVSLQHMTEWLEQENARLERLGTAPPDAEAATKQAEAEVAKQGCGASAAPAVDLSGWE